MAMTPAQAWAYYVPGQTPEEFARHAPGETLSAAVAAYTWHKWSLVLRDQTVEDSTERVKRVAEVLLRIDKLLLEHLENCGFCDEEGK